MMIKLNKKILKALKKRKGAALIQVMMMSGLLGVISLGILHLNESIRVVSKKTAQSMNVSEIFKKIQTNLKNKETCDATFKGKSPTGNGTNINVIKSFVLNKTIFEVGKVYGTGSGKVSIKRMTLKNYDKGVSTFEVAFERGKSEKLLFIRRLQINTKLEKGVVGECLLDINGLAKRNCENVLQGDFSDGVNCKSIKIPHAEKNEFALKSKGNITVDGDLVAENLITTSKNQLIEDKISVKTNDSDGGVFLGKDNQVKLKVDSRGRFLINLKEKGNAIKALNLILKEKNNIISFKLDNDNMVIDGNRKLNDVILKGFTKHSKDGLDNYFEYENNPKGIVATRKWFYKNLRRQLLSPQNALEMQEVVKKELDEIEKKLENALKDPNEKDVFLAFGKNICANYFDNNYEWDEGNLECELKSIGVKTCTSSTINESGFLIITDSKEIACKKFQTSKIVKDCTKQENFPCLERVKGVFDGLVTFFTGKKFDESCLTSYPENPYGSDYKFNWSRLVKNSKSPDDRKCRVFSVGQSGGMPDSGGNSDAPDLGEHPSGPRISSFCDTAMSTGSDTNTQTNISGSDKCISIKIERASIDGVSKQGDCDTLVGRGNYHYKNKTCYFYKQKRDSCRPVKAVKSGSDYVADCSGGIKTESKCSDTGSAALCNELGPSWEVAELDSYEANIDDAWDQIRDDYNYPTN